MLRVRFRVNVEDPRPVHWPVKHPYWVTGEGGDDPDRYAVVVSYADDERYIFENWPEATWLDFETVEGYTFTDRFPKPDWFHGVNDGENS